MDVVVAGVVAAGAEPGRTQAASVRDSPASIALVIGFVPPTGISHWPTPIYIGAMLAAIVICSVPPFIIEKIKKLSWIEAHPDEVLLDLDEGKTAPELADEEAAQLALVSGASGNGASTGSAAASYSVIDGKVLEGSFSQGP